MDPTSLLRTFGSLGAVLGLLSLALWATRRYNIRLPGSTQAHGLRRLAVVERVALDGRRSVALIRRDGREHLILISPEGHHVVERGIEAPEPVAAEAGDFASILAATTAAQDRAAIARAASEALRKVVARLAPTLATFQLHARRIVARATKSAQPVARVHVKTAAKSRTARPANSKSKSRAAKPAMKRAQTRG